ncbi:hypothetical protein NDN08_000350 [Rhodosorus marinus]|uniref:Plastid lipid-associated protein/fibrillin conserved domain-containing protein n=1 Tax=Rhodosorus marinus TaxID=101924 RepID=A0AAV8URT0_9RHOD|nr:hypothetical protein NDN08_000350 [Rhodosorus marinus]
MSKSDRRAQVKQELREKIQIARKEQRVVRNAPATNVNLRKELEQDIVSTIEELESLAPYAKPLIENPGLIDGIWRTLYSDAREISFLAKLPGGFKCGQVLQVIDLANSKFFNIAVIVHSTGLLKGFVRVSAIFTPAPNRSLVKKRGVFQLDGNLILIQFKLRSYHLARLAIFPNIFKKQPIQAVNANDGGGYRVPSLLLTYIDEEIRVGRSADGRIFLLEKIEKIPWGTSLPKGIFDKTDGF